MGKNINNNSLEELYARRDIWSKKKTLRLCYLNWYNTLKPYVKEGPTLEIGSGSGWMKEFWEGPLLTTDIQNTPWVDQVMDAHAFCFEDKSFDNIFGIDILHHLHSPDKFFNEAFRTLKNGGKLILMEPWITPISYIFYKFMHHEKTCFKKALIDDKNPWDGNIALPNIVFKSKKDFLNKHPNFKFEVFKRFSFFDSQLAGGFRPWALIKNEKIYNLFLKLDRKLSWLMPLIGFRTLIILKKTIS